MTHSEANYVASIDDEYDMYGVMDRKRRQWVVRLADHDAAEILADTLNRTGVIDREAVWEEVGS